VAMSTVAILILVAIGLVLMMRLNDRKEGLEYTPSDQGTSIASYLVAGLVLLGITVILVRACQGTF
jgi:hypothetical protein